MLGRLIAALAQRRKSPAPASLESEVERAQLALAKRDMAGAVEALGRAVLLQSGNASIHANLALACNEIGEVGRAIEAGERALQLDPDLAEAWHNLAICHNGLGELDAAEHALRNALRIKPDFHLAHSTLLCVMNASPRHSAEAVFAEHRNWSVCHADRFDHGATRPVDADPGRRLRIGYVSADLRAHAVASFMAPVLARHDQRQFDIVCYHNWGAEDASSAALRRSGMLWRNVHDLGDDALAAQIRADRIDILVDLSGHTVGNRLLVFARRPAPVQATWLGYVQTTGLAQIDWRITDAVTDPPGITETLHSERLLRMPAYLCCFDAGSGSPDVNALPLLSRGHATFGAFNSAMKLNDRVLALWGRILAACPGSRLLMVAERGEVAAVRDRLLARMCAAGVDTARVTLLGRRSAAAFQALFHEVDLALDPFPYNGGTTTLHSLWMGVPVLTLAGRSPLARYGASMLTQVGLGHFVANDEENYLAIACSAVQDAGSLAALRGQLRPRFAASALADAGRFTADIESAYRRMWRDCCENK